MNLRSYIKKIIITKLLYIYYFCFDWASKGVLEEGLIKNDHKDRLINSQRSEIQLPRAEGKTTIASLGTGPVTSEKHYPVKSVAVKTDVKSEKALLRSITVRVDSDTNRIIEKEQKNGVMDYLKGLSKDAEVSSSESGGNTEYIVSFKADSQDKLLERSAPFLKNQNFTWAVAKKSIFFPVTQYSDRADLSYFLGKNVEVKDGYTYQLLYNGNLVTTPDGKKEVIEDNKPVSKEKLWSQAQPNFMVSVFIKKTTVLYFVVLGLAILLGLILIIAAINYFKRNPGKLKLTFAPNLSSPVYDSKQEHSNGCFCYDCGAKQENKDRYCYHCGTNNELLERGAHS